MRTDRRSLLKAGAIASAAGAAPLAMAAGRSKSVVMFDSREPESLAFARTLHSSGSSPIDLYREHHTHFAALRAGDHPGTIEGLTGWGDWVAVRGELEAQGYRVAAEEAIKSRTGKTHLFRWTMKAR